MNKVLKGNLIFLSFILLVTLIFIERYNGENILLILSLIFYSKLQYQIELVLNYDLRTN